MSNIFSKIVSGEIKSKILLENSYAICIADIKPQAKQHYLVITRNSYKDFSDFMQNADKKEIFEVLQFIHNIAKHYNLFSYQIITNAGNYQEIPHFHIHILSNY